MRGQERGGGERLAHNRAQSHQRPDLKPSADRSRRSHLETVVRSRAAYETRERRLYEVGYALRAGMGEPACSDGPPQYHVEHPLRLFHR